MFMSAFPCVDSGKPEVAVRENWRTYLSFILVGAIFIACQMLSGGASTRSTGITSEGADSSHRDLSRLETTGRRG